MLHFQSLMIFPANNLIITLLYVHQQVQLEDIAQYDGGNRQPAESDVKESNVADWSLTALLSLLESVTFRDLNGNESVMVNQMIKLKKEKRMVCGNCKYLNNYLLVWYCITEAFFIRRFFVPVNQNSVTCTCHVCCQSSGDHNNYMMIPDSTITDPSLSLVLYLHVYRCPFTQL